MGRHSAGAPLSDVAPITDPRLFDRPLEIGHGAPARFRPAAVAPHRDRGDDDLRPSGPRAMPPFAPIAVRTDAPRLDEVASLRSRSTPLGDRTPPARSARPRDQRYSRTGPVPIVTDPKAPTSPIAFTRKREAVLAAAALAVVGAMSGAAALLPSNDSEARAAGKVGTTTASIPTVGTPSRAPAGAGSRKPSVGSSDLKSAMRRQHLPRVRPSASQSASASPRTLPTHSARPVSSASSDSDPTSTASTSTPTSTPAVAGSLPANPSNLGAGTFTLHDFTTQSSGAVLSGGVLKGAGVGKTVVQMVRGTSTKASTVPGNGNNQGGLANPTNPLYLLRGVNRLEDVTVRGTAQGHLYNGVYMSGANIVIKHAEIDDIPGDSHANPGETFAVNVNRATGTNTVDDLTINGGSGSLASAAGLAINNSDADWNISDLTTNDLKYSAGIALWQVRGTLNVHNYVQRGGARSLGAERLGGRVNLYDPVWSAGTTGHDVTYTWDGGYSGGSINFYYSSASKVPDRKIQIITNKASGIASSVHVYIGGVQQTASKYVTVN